MLHSFKIIQYSNHYYQVINICRFLYWYCRDNDDASYTRDSFYLVTKDGVRDTYYWVLDMQNIVYDNVTDETYVFMHTWLNNRW